MECECDFMIDSFCNIFWNCARSIGKPSVLKMYRLLYEDHGYRRPVRSWNAADVMGEDGMLQHGTVIDVEPDGLTVDFGCDGQRRQLVKYGEAFGYYRVYHSGDELRSGCAVEVLLRRDPQSPWVWRPATLVTADLPCRGCEMLVLVDVQLGGILRREVVGYEQIRPLQSTAQLLARVLHQDTFMVTSVSLPAADIAAFGPTHLPLWNVFCQQLYFGDVSVRSVSSSSLFFLQRSIGYPESQSDREHLVRHVREYVEARIKTGVMWVEKGWRCCFQLACDSAETETSADRLLYDVHHLVLGEVFGYLDTIDRASHRRVCRLFDELLSDTLSMEIRLTYRDCSLPKGECCGCSQHVSDYSVLAPMLKSVTAHTRLVVLANGEPYALSQALRTLGICTQLGKCPAGQVLVVAGDCNLQGTGFEGFWDNADLLAKSVTGGWCKKLLLKQCSMSRSLPDLQFSGLLRENSLQQDLCQLVESQLPAIDVQRISQWVPLTVNGRRRRVKLVLSEFTSSDPRATNAYKGYDWTEYNLASLDIGKLSHLAQYALSRYLPLYPLDQLPFAEDID